jgi:iron complex outermembrane receptor protein
MWRGAAAGSAAGAVFAVLAMLAPARAQQAVTLPEVSVSATRIERDNLDLPLSIDSIERRTIREAGPQVNLSEALGRVPGIAVQNRQNYAQDLQISSRGFGARAAFGVRGIRLVADGIPATMPDGQGQAANFSLSSAQRIEVLRGPFSSLHGNAAGGVVQIFTAEAPPEPTLLVDLSLGSHRSARAGLQYGGRHGPLGLRLEAARFETDGYRDHGSARRDTSNARIGYDMGRAGRLTLVLNSLDQPETEDPLGLTAAQLAQNPRQAVAAAYAFNTRKSIAQGQAGLTYDIDLGNGHAVQARAYIGDRRVTQYLAIPLAVQAAATQSGGVVDLDRGFGGLGLRWTREGQLAGGRASFSTGIDHDRMDERRRGFINNLGVSGALKRDEDNRVANTDVYAQAEWQIPPRLALLAGLRHSRVRFESRDYFIVPGNGDDSGTVEFVRTTPALGASFRVSPQMNLYANAGRGFETPTFAELAYRSGGASGLNFALRPSTSLHRELGIKALTGDRGQLNAALFRIDTRDEIVVNSAASGRSDFRNAAGTRRKGLELSWQQRHAGGFESALAWTLLDASFRQPFVSGTPPQAVAAGNRLPGVAARQFYGELLWRDAASGFHAGIELRHAGRVYVDDRNSESAAAYTIGNLRAGFRQQGRGWRFNQYLRMDNVADRAYVGSVIVADGNGRYYEPAPGRTLTVAATFEFSY